jgi:hypothetical protein
LVAAFKALAEIVIQHIEKLVNDGDVEAQELYDGIFYRGLKVLGSNWTVNTKTTCSDLVMRLLKVRFYIFSVLRLTFLLLRPLLSSSLLKKSMRVKLQRAYKGYLLICSASPASSPGFRRSVISSTLGETAMHALLTSNSCIFQHRSA